MKPIYTEIIRRTTTLTTLTLFAYLVVDNHTPILYVLPLLALGIYRSIPFAKLPKNGVYFSRFNSVYIPDLLVAFIWLLGWLLFFFILKEDIELVTLDYILLISSVALSLTLSFFIMSYANNWFLFQDGEFCFSDTEGIECHKSEHIIAIYEYNSTLPKWIALLLFNFKQTSTQRDKWRAITDISQSTIGIMLEFQNGRKVKIMANYLEIDPNFTEALQSLLLNSTSE